MGKIILQSELSSVRIVAVLGGYYFTMATLTLGATQIAYVVEERPRRRYPAIRVEVDRRVTVLVPTNYPQNQIEPLLHQKADWILKHVTAPSRASSTKTFADGDQFMFLGFPIRLEVFNGTVTGSISTVTYRNHVLTMNVALETKGQQVDIIRSALVQWFSRQAEEYFPDRIRYFSRKIEVEPKRLKISEYKSRWGFCRDDGMIALNWRIIQAPPSVINYVVVHELVHLAHPHHRPIFWQTVGDFMPDFDNSKTWLKEHGGELIW